MTTVQDLQRRLIALGYDVGAADGIRGRRTIAAIKAFQIANHLQVDGIAGPKTIRALFGGALQAPADSPDATPWLDIAERKKGLHEKRDNAALRAFLKSDGGTVGDPAQVPWCFAGEIEIMTEDGWQRFDSLSASRVWQVDSDGRATLSHYVPIQKRYEGLAYEINGPAVNAICDAGHRWWGQWGRTQDETFNTLDKLTSEGCCISAPQSGAAGVDLSDQEIAFVAAFISDGFEHNRRVEFSVSRKRKIDVLTGWSPAHSYTQARAYGEVTREPLTVFSFVRPEFFDEVFAGKKRLSRSFVNGLSAEQAGGFLRAYAIFDGNTRDDGRITLYTSDPATRDDLITIAVLAGYTPRVGPGGCSDLTRKEAWRVAFMPRMDIRKRIRQQDVTEIEFDGDMFCVSVPHGRIIIRGKNHEPCITGNCGDFVETCLALALPDEALPNNPYGAINWLAFGKPVTPRKGAVLVFWRGSPASWTGHVGFYVGEDATHFHVLGGNQADSINVSRIAKNRLRPNGSRWPLTAIDIGEHTVVSDGAGLKETTDEE